MNVLIIEDHSLIIQGYVNILTDIAPVGSVALQVAKSAESIFYIYQDNDGNHMRNDLAIIDYHLINNEGKNINGLDIALTIRRRDPACKIVIITAEYRLAILFDIYKKVDPEGLLLKNDLDYDLLKSYLEKVFNGAKVRSLTVTNQLQSIWKYEFLIDDRNREILYYLSLGYKIKDIADAVLITSRSVQRHISSMKATLLLDDSKSLLETVRNLGIFTLLFILTIMA